MSALSSLPGNLPAQLNSFVARQNELEKIKQVLSRNRLLTLTGIGGSGKTRLALEAARLLSKDFPDGVWLVRLEALSEPRLVLQQIVQFLGLREQPERPLLTTLVNFLKTRRLLLMLDNCEHLLEACAYLAESLLQECPDLYILATSRENLRIDGEIVLPVPPLEMPSPEQFALLPLPQLAANAAIQLFLARGQVVQPEFKLTEQNRDAILQLCHTLDGLPLSLELAAARLRGLSVTQLANRLESTLGARFQLLTGGSRTALPRHQTLEALLDWSYERLTEREQVILRRLSVFMASFPLEGVEAVCAGAYTVSNGQGQLEAGEVLDLLLALVNKSLVQVDEAPENQAEPRYRMLETIRQYSLGKLAQAGETSLLRQRHADWCIYYTEKSESYLQGSEQASWLRLLEQEHPNFRVALDWTLQSHEWERALRLGGALWRFWQTLSYFEEARRWLTEILDRTKGANVKPERRAKVLQGAGVLFSFSDYTSSMSFHEENLSLRRLMGDKPGLIAALKDLGWVALHHNDFERAKTFGEESLKLAQELEDNSGRAASLFVLAVVAYYQGNPARSEELGQECLQIWQELGDLGSCASVLSHLGTLALGRADYPQAAQAIVASLNLNWELNNKLGIANTILQIIELSLAQPLQPDGTRRAVRLLGWEERLSEDFGGRIPPLARLSFDASVATTRTRLDETTYHSLWTQGRTLTLEQAVNLAREVNLVTTQPPTTSEELPAIAENRSASSAKTDELREKLTRRELEILELVTTGLTNAQIAEKLFITSRTVNAHLTSIYAKLEVTSRSGAIRYALEHRLV